MTSKDEDLDEFQALLDITVNTARGTEMTFTWIQQTLAYTQKYDKTKQVKDLQQQLLTTNESLCQSLDLVDKLNHDVNDLLKKDEKP